jgi:hypothetical protein
VKHCNGHVSGIDNREALFVVASKNQNPGHEGDILIIDVVTPFKIGYDFICEHTDSHHETP